jgi:hypothetical protein
MGLSSEVGALAFPIVGTGATNLSALDPARDILLALFASAITAELDPVWEPATRRTPLEPADHPVRARHPYPPEQKTLQQVTTKFPALFVYRQEEPIRPVQFTLWQRRYTSRWGIDYFLGPLDAGDAGRVGDILIAVGKILGEVIEDGGHSSYAGGANVLLDGGLGTCGFSTAVMIDFKAGGAKLADNGDKGPTFLACSCTLETTEMVKPRAAGVGADLAGVDFTLGTGTNEGLIPNLIEASTDEKP